MRSSSRFGVGMLVVGVAALTLLSGCSCGSGTKASGDTCRDGSECASGVCNAGQCVPAEAGLCDGAECSPSGTVCVDGDGDGFGAGCLRGIDCDDSDPKKGNRELCSPADGIDNDCDGNTDESASPACGCDPNCNSDVVGPGTGTGFDSMKDPSDSVTLDSNGYLVLKATEIRQPYIWIVNTGEGTVSKFSTDATNPDGTFKELGRYLTGQSRGRSTGPSVRGNNTPPTTVLANDPSRTTVNTLGDVYVGNRNQSSITKLSYLGEQCPDANKNGTIETSRDLNGDGKIDYSTIDNPDPTKREVLPWRQDECMLWSTSEATDANFQVNDGDVIRAMAAQDEYGPDGEVTPYVWVGGWNKKVWKIDGNSGRIVVETESPVRPYGFALDGNGQLWISSRSDGGTTWLGRIDTKQCTNNANCGLGVVKYQCTCDTNGANCTGCTKVASCTGKNCQFACGDEGTTCAKQRIATVDNKQLYGITVDKKQRVWLGGQGIFYYDQTRPYDSTKANGGRWEKLYPGRDTYGIAADGLGFVYVGSTGGGLYVLEADNFPKAGSYGLVNGTTMGSNPTSSFYGVAVDANGKVWSMHKGSADADGRDDEFATVVEPQVPTPAPMVANFANVSFKLHTVTGPDQRKSAVNLDFPYTYSDMTGIQLRLATNRLGQYQHIFHGCATQVGTPTWQNLHWQATIPGGTHVTWYVRTGKTLAELAAASFTKLTPNAPPATSPVPLDGILGAGISDEYLEVKVQLVVDTPGNSVLTPTIKNFEATFTCEGTVI